MRIFSGDIELPAIDEAKMMVESQYVKYKGRTRGSLEDEDTAGLDYNVLSGDKMLEYFKPLCDVLIPKIESNTKWFFGEQFDILNSEKRRVNINTLVKGQRYEKHIDGNKVTAILFLNDDYEGGQLVVNGIKVTPRRGKYLIFEGGKYEHEVLEVTKGVRHTFLLAFNDCNKQVIKELENTLY